MKVRKNLKRKMIRLHRNVTLRIEAGLGLLETPVPWSCPCSEVPGVRRYAMINQHIVTGTSKGLALRAGK
jgi:hypothetical protein